MPRTESHRIYEDIDLDAGGQMLHKPHEAQIDDWFATQGLRMRFLTGRESKRSPCLGIFGG